MPGSMKSFECPEKDVFIACFFTKSHGGFHQFIADSFPPYYIGNDKIAKVRAFIASMASINGYMSFNLPIHPYSPETVPYFIIVAKKVRQISSSFCLKDHAESPVVVIVGGAEFDHAAYRSGNVSLPYFNLSVSHGLPFA